jgi:transposase-like protein
MPWKASSVMEERLRFVARLLDGEAMTDVCRDFGVSRKTGYKIFDRYREYSLEALTDRSGESGAVFIRRAILIEEGRREYVRIRGDRVPKCARYRMQHVGWMTAIKEAYFVPPVLADAEEFANPRGRKASAK